MIQRHKLRLSVLVVALTTTAVFASTYAIEKSSHATATAQGATIVTEKETVVVMPEEKPIEIVETVIFPAQGIAPEPVVVPAPVAPPRAVAPAEPSIIVTEKRLTLDQRIQADVMDVLASDPSISGKIGVESHDAVVHLSGYTMTAGQAWRAGRDAGKVLGVRYVVNEIRPRVGAVTH